METKTKNLYGNWKMLAPDGTILAITTKKRGMWYIERDLAIMLDPDDGPGIKLLFEPQGTSSDDYMIRKKINKCVVCGSTKIKNLTKHHVIPVMYRRHFPLEQKSRSSHDVLIICRECHNEYEKYHGDKLKDQFAKKYDAPLSKRKQHSDEYRSIMIARVIVERWDELPGYRLEELLNDFHKLTGINPDTFEELYKFIETQNKILNINSKTHGEKIIDIYKDRLQEFSELWRKNFKDSMKPKFLPIGWDIKRKI